RCFQKESKDVGTPLPSGLDGMPDHDIDQDPADPFRRQVSAACRPRPVPESLMLSGHGIRESIREIRCSPDKAGEESLAFHVSRSGVLQGRPGMSGSIAALE